jgi:hypothetical protein
MLSEGRRAKRRKQFVMQELPTGAGAKDALVLAAEATTGGMLLSTLAGDCGAICVLPDAFKEYWGRFRQGIERDIREIERWGKANFCPPGIRELPDHAVWLVAGLRVADHWAGGVVDSLAQIEGILSHVRRQVVGAQAQYDGRSQSAPARIA